MAGFKSCVVAGSRLATCNQTRLSIEWDMVAHDSASPFHPCMHQHFTCPCNALGHWVPPYLFIFVLLFCLWYRYRAYRVWMGWHARDGKKIWWLIVEKRTPYVFCMIMGMDKLSVLQNQNSW